MAGTAKVTLKQKNKNQSPEGNQERIPKTGQLRKCSSLVLNNWI